VHQRVAREAYSYRSDPSVPAFPDDRPVVIFDGHCVLCSRFARFILRHDRHARLRLLAAQAPLGQALYRHYGLEPLDFETNVLLEGGRAWFRSAGTLRIFAHLDLPWSLLRGLRHLPAPPRDALYDLIARNRLRWFGTRATCFASEPRHSDRFLA
jgi:predicted DCC family thiol-disulfide oxidoreductase YuxK